MWVYWKYISNCLTMCKVKPHYYVKLEIYFQNMYYTSFRRQDPLFYFTPQYSKKNFWKFSQ